MPKITRIRVKQTLVNRECPSRTPKEGLPSRTLPRNYFFTKMLLTLALWLNLLSSHFTTILGPPNGVIGLYSRSKVHMSSSLWYIWDVLFFVSPTFLEADFCESSSTKTYMHRSSFAKEICGNSSKKLLLLRLRLFLHLRQCLQFQNEI